MSVARRPLVVSRRAAHVGLLLIAASAGCGSSDPAGGDVADSRAMPESTDAVTSRATTQSTDVSESTIAPSMPPETAGGVGGPHESGSTRPPGGEDEPEMTGWQRLADPPLRPRASAIVADLDGRIVVVGGWEFLCPPAADCAIEPDTVTRFVDGAVYDGATGDWAPIADAPIPLVSAASTTRGTELYVAATCVAFPSCVGDTAVVRYRSTDDEWDVLPAPGLLTTPMLATLADGTVIAFSGSDEGGESSDYRLVDEWGWEPLPDDPLPAVYDRFVLGDDRRVFIFGSPIDGDESTKLGAVFDVDEGTWTELTASNGAGYQVWAGEHGFYLNPHFGPSVEGGVYDPIADAWSDFPERPASDSWRNDMAGILLERDATYEYASGWARDPTSDRWIEIPARPGATTEGESITNSARSLVVYGGQDWSADGGRLLNEVWIWTPPSEAG